MMKRRKIAAIVGLFLLALTLVRLAWINVQTTSTQVEAEGGFWICVIGTPLPNRYFLSSGNGNFIRRSFGDARSGRYD